MDVKKSKKNDIQTEIQRQFRLTGGLTRVKLIEYLPALIITNISTLLLVSVDGLVVGNLEGADALASVSLAAPVDFFICSLSILIASGSAMSLGSHVTSSGVPTKECSFNRNRILFSC